MSRSFGHLFFVLAIVFGLAIPQKARGQQYDHLDQSCFYIARNIDKDYSASQFSKNSIEKIADNSNRFAGLQGRMELNNSKDLFAIKNDKTKKYSAKYDLSRYLDLQNSFSDSYAQPASSSCEYENAFSICHLNSLANDKLIHYPQIDPSFTFKGSDLPADISFLNPGHAGLQPSGPFNTPAQYAYPPADPFKKLPIPRFENREQSSVCWWLPSSLNGKGAGSPNQNGFGNSPLAQAMEGLAEIFDAYEPPVEPMDQGSIDYWNYYGELDKYDMDAQTRALIDRLVAKWQISRWLLGQTRNITKPIQSWSRQILIDKGTEFIGQIERLHHIVRPIVKPQQENAWGINDYMDLARGYYIVGKNISNHPLFTHPDCWFASKCNEIEMGLCGTRWLYVWYDLKSNLQQSLDAAKEAENQKVDRLRALAHSINLIGIKIQDLSYELFDAADTKESDIARQSNLFEMR